MSTETETTTCERCGVALKVNPNRNPDARLLRRSLATGVCAGCSLTAFLKQTEPLATVIRTRGTSVLAMAAVQEQVGRLLAAGNADADPGELDWPSIIANWDLAS